MIFAMCAFSLDLEDMTLGQGYDTRLGGGQQLCEILFRSKKCRVMAQKIILPLCVLWPWSWRYVHVKIILLQGQDTPMGHGQLYEIKSKSNIRVVSYYLERIMAMYVVWPWASRCDLGSISWHTFGHGLQLCEILLKSNRTVRSYCLDKEYG